MLQIEGLSDGEEDNFQFEESTEGLCASGREIKIDGAAHLFSREGD